MEIPQHSYLSRKPKKGVFELLSIAIGFLKNRPALSVPALISLGPSIVQNTLLVLAFLYMVENVFEIDILKEIVKEGEIGLIPELLRYISVFIRFYAIAFILGRILSKAFYSTFFYPYAYKLLKGEESDFFIEVRNLLRYFGKMLKAALVIEGISIGIPVLILVYALDNFLKIMHFEEMISLKLSWSIENLVILTSLLLVILLLAGMALIFGILFIFVYQIIVVEDLSLPTAIAKSVFLALKNIVDIAIYMVLQFILTLIIVLATLLLQLFSVQISELVYLVTGILFYPILDLVILGIYLQSINQSIIAPKETVYSFTEVFLRIFNKGVAVFKNFISLENLPYLIYAVLVYLTGFILGTEYSKGPLGEIFSIFISSEKLNVAFQGAQFSLSSSIFAHNWQVSASTILSGVLTFAIPAINCFFNGVILGLMYGLIPVEIFIIGIFPHGVIELPSFLLAASSGIKLGYYIIAKREELGTVLREAVYLSIGLAPLFLIAALIESLITPQVLKIFSVKF